VVHGHIVYRAKDANTVKPCFHSTFVIEPVS
jgi:hypothetical protein